MHSLSLCEKTHKTIQGKRKERCEASGELRLSLPFIYLPRPPILCRTEPQWQTTNQQHRIRHKSHTGWPISSGLGWVDIVLAVPPSAYLLELMGNQQKWLGKNACGSTQPRSDSETSCLTLYYTHSSLSLTPTFVLILNLARTYEGAKFCQAAQIRHDFGKQANFANFVRI